MEKIIKEFRLEIDRCVPDIAAGTCSLWTDTLAEVREELSTAQIKDRNHIFFILKVKEKFPITHVQTGSSEIKSPHSK